MKASLGIRSLQTKSLPAETDPYVIQYEQWTLNINGDLVSTTICKQVIFLQKSAKLAGVQEYTPRTEPVQICKNLWYVMWQTSGSGIWLKHFDHSFTLYNPHV